jgi:hypothetical protein
MSTCTSPPARRPHCPLQILERNTKPLRRRWCSGKDAVWCRREDPCANACRSRNARADVDAGSCPAAVADTEPVRERDACGRGSHACMGTGPGGAVRLDASTGSTDTARRLSDAELPAARRTTNGHTTRHEPRAGAHDPPAGRDVLRSHLCVACRRPLCFVSLVIALYASSGSSLCHKLNSTKYTQSQVAPFRPWRYAQRSEHPQQHQPLLEQAFTATPASPRVE